MRRLSLALAGIAFAAGVLAGGVLAAGVARAEEPRAVRIGQQYGFFYLPLVVMKERWLLERAVAALGLPEPEVTFTRMTSGAPLNDALLAGSIDMAAAGTSPAITIWSRTRKNLKVRMVAALGDVPVFLTTNRPAFKSLADILPTGRIALPAVGVSMQAVLLRMAAAAEFGEANWARLDARTVSLGHPDAMTALLSGKSQITAHFGNPPFQDAELLRPGITRVLSSYDVLGGPHTSSVLYATTKFHDASPKTVAALIAALRQADAFIAAQPRETAEIYQRVEPTPLSIDELATLIRGPSIRFTVEPERTMAFADFQARTGEIPEAPADWREMFFGEIADGPGG